MYNLRSQAKQTEDRKLNTVILKSLFNIISQNPLELIGVQNKLIFFKSSKEVSNDGDGYDIILLIGYQNFIVNRQTKILKQYIIEEGNNILMCKSNQFIIVKPQSINLWKFDRFYNCNYYQEIFQRRIIRFAGPAKRIRKIYSQIHAILLNKNEDLLVFEQLNKMFFLKKDENDLWLIQQQIDCENNMENVRFNESENILLASFFSQILNIYHKNQKQHTWKKTHQIEMKQFYPFYFIDDQIFILFQNNANIIYEISKANQQAKEKARTVGFEQNNYELGLIEIKSKNLAIVNGHHITFLKHSTHQQLEVKKLPSITTVNCPKNSELLFFNFYEYISQFQVFSIYVN